MTSVAVAENDVRSVSHGTFCHQDKLPRLPVPTLEHTCDLFLEMVQPIVGKKDYADAVEAVQAFREDKDAGPRLQNLLLEYDKKTTSGSYIADYHNIEGYLKSNVKVVINSNPFFLLEDDPTSKRNDQVVRATSLVYSALKFVSALKQDRMQPDFVKATPLCMSQYKRMFGSARIAEDNADRIKVVSNSGHVVVLCHRRFYFFQAMWEDGTLAVTERDLKNNLKAILLAAGNGEPEHEDFVGVFTTEARQTWANIRSSLETLSPVNKEIFSVIDSALFVVCLDDEEPVTTDERVANMLHGSYRLDAKNQIQVGSCCNRWYDKMQLIVCKNGAAGINFEHSTVDGHTVLRFASDVFADNILRFANTITANVHGKRYINDLLEQSYRPPDDTMDIEPKRMSWVLNTRIRQQMLFAETAMSDLICKTQTRTLEFRDYGKTFITSNKMSPDGFVQIAMNTAYYMLYGSFVSTYESVMTKHFYHGRTEAGRTVTSALAKFAMAFVDESVANGEKVALLRAALTRQTAVIRKCQSGNGVDRHLAGLSYMLTLENQKTGNQRSLPRLFTTTAYKTLKTDVLSTSNCGNPSLRMFGFGPTCEQGFGIGYIIRTDGLKFCVSSHHRQTNRYIHTLEKFLREIGKLFKPKLLSTVRDMKTEEQKRKELERSLAGEADEDSGYGYFDMGDLPSAVVVNTSFNSRLVRSKSFVNV
jgi:carnitine O-acetyltransferase